MIQRIFTLTFNTSKNGCVAVCHNAAALLQHEKCLLMISSGVGCISEVMEDVMLLYGVSHFAAGKMGTRNRTLFIIKEQKGELYVWSFRRYLDCGILF